MTARSYTFAVPGPMRGKGRPRFSRKSGRTYTDEKTVSAEGLVRTYALSHLNAHGAAQPAFDGPVLVYVKIEIEPPASWSKRKRADALEGRLYPTSKPDLDNCGKLIADSLNGIAWIDDSRIVSFKMHKRYATVAQTTISISEAV